MGRIGPLLSHSSIPARVWGKWLGPSPCVPSVPNEVEPHRRGQTYGHAIRQHSRTREGLKDQSLRWNANPVHKLGRLVLIAAVPLLATSTARGLGNAIGNSGAEIRTLAVLQRPDFLGPFPNQLGQQRVVPQHFGRQLLGGRAHLGWA